MRSSCLEAPGDEGITRPVYGRRARDTVRYCTPPERLPQRYSQESMRPVIDSSADADVHKGAIEHDDPCDTSNAPGLDDDGLPNDDVAIAADAIGAREDGSQG
jgi:hypothetical protein